MLIFVRPDAIDDGLTCAWANAPTTSLYTPNATCFFTPLGPAQAQRFGVASHRMNFPAFALRGLGGGHVQVNGYGPTEARCLITAWDTDSVDVRCHHPGGGALDAPYNVMFLKPIAMPEPGVVAMLASGGALIGWLRFRSRAH